MAAEQASATKQSPREIPIVSSNANTASAYRWRAVVNRDRNAGNFIYAVQSTRIYCRPWCPARLARRANIIFYDSSNEAQAAGYRPCMRCKPDLDEVEDPQQSVVERACQTIKSLATQSREATLQQLAIDAKLTPSHFHKVFKKLTGVTPKQYAADARCERKVGNHAGAVKPSSSAGSVSSRSLQDTLSNHYPENNDSLTFDVAKSAGFDIPISDSQVTCMAVEPLPDTLWMSGTDSRSSEHLDSHDAILGELQPSVASEDDFALDEFLELPADFFAVPTDPSFSSGWRPWIDSFDPELWKIDMVLSQCINARTVAIICLFL